MIIIHQVMINLSHSHSEVDPNRQFEPKPIRKIETETDLT